MMLSLILAAALAAPLPAAPPAPADDATARMAELHQLYDQSCRQRAYGQFDDMCDNLRRQIHDAEAEARKAKPAETAKPAAAPAG